MKSKILIYISNSQGELDWIFPIIVELSRKKHNVNIYFNTLDKNLIIKRGEIPYKLFKKFNITTYTALDFTKTKYFSDILLFIFTLLRRRDLGLKILNRLTNNYFNFFSNKFSKRIFNRVRPDLLFKDVGSDTNLRLELSKILKINNGKTIIFPHGTEIFVESRPKKNNYFGDLLLVSSNKMKSHYSKTFKGLPSSIIGIPRYDIKWLNLIKKNTNYPKTKKSKFKILFITRGVHPTDLSNDDFNYLVNSIFDICNKSDDIELLIRNHPRYPKSQLLEILSNYPNLNYRFEDSDLVILKDEINLVVSMWSTMILDALFLNLPVIEFFKCRNNREWPKNDLGELITGYEKSKIVISAKSKDDLSKFINETKQGDYTIYHSIFNSFKKIYNIENSINKTIKAITNN